MKNKRFIIMGLVSLFAFAGCAPQSTPTSSNQTTKTQADVSAELKNQEQADKAAEVVKELEAEEKQKAAQKVAEEKKAKDNSEVKNLIALGDLIGKKQADVKNILGKPEKSTHLEKTKILLADYFKLTILEQVTTIEVVYNDDQGAVNFINMTCKQADDVKALVEAMTNELTTQYGESSIEKIIDVNGTKKKEWYDKKHTYALSYFENNVYFDIYETDK